MESLEKRFWAKVDKTTTPSGCWEWTGCRNIWNYGKIQIKGKSVGSHRVAWELTNGSIPSGIQVCHHCDNPPCCRPDHLFLGNQSANISDSVKKGRQIGNRKITEEKLQELLYLRTEGFSQRELGEIFHLSLSSISRLLKGEKHGGT